MEQSHGYGELGCSPNVSLHFVRVCVANIAERSAEDMQMARSKTKSLHGVELFSTELGRKKRECASGIFDELLQAKILTKSNLMLRERAITVY